MLFSKSLLSQRVQLPTDNQELQSKLIAKVFEIEHGAKVRTLPTGLVLGKVTSVEKHPNADTLFVCQVDCGSHGGYQICTGGENVAMDQYVPVALPGCHLPIIDLTIGSRKMRGLDSNGMICSKGELGINEDEDKHWIWSMGEDLSLSDDMIGKSLQELFPERENIVFEVESVAITNRPDLWGHFGLAAECRSVFSDYQTSPTQFDTALQNIHSFSPSKLNDLIKHDIVPNIQTSKVSYYSLSKVINIINDKSVFQGRLMLTDLDHTPRQNRVDYSNRFMEVYGQPIHVFDADSITGNIIVDEIKTSEKFIDLTGKEHELVAGDIVIRDSEKILALGGIIGGLSCAFSDATKNILIEVAHFDPIQIRKTATRLGLRTDASMRFEKAINPLWTMYCSWEQTNIISKNHNDHKTGEFAGITYIHQLDKINTDKRAIAIDIEQTVNYLQGSHNEQVASQIQPILQSLGYTIISADKNTIEVAAPLRRSDINIIQDVYEDLARHIGLENIPEIAQSIVPKKTQHSLPGFVNQVSQLLVDGARLDQVETYPRYSQERIGRLGLQTQDHFELQNPTDASTPYMAHTLLPGLLELAQKNYRQVAPIKVFEIGKVFTINNQGIPEETKVLSVLILHKRHDGATRQNDNYLHTKQILDLISHTFQIKELNLKASHRISYYHPNKQADVICETDKSLGYIGQIHPSLLDEVGIGSDYQVSFMELKLGALFALANTREPNTYQSLQNQIITRDLSFEVTNDKTFDLIVQTIANNEQVQEYKIFDLYKKDNLKSISITVSILGDGTATTDQINAIMNSIIQQVELTGATLKGQKA